MKKIPVYKIEPGIPMPMVKAVPLDRMEIDDSILFPIENRAVVQTLASRMKKKGKKFVIKKLNDKEARVWRIS